MQKNNDHTKNRTGHSVIGAITVALRGSIGLVFSLNSSPAFLICFDRRSVVGLNATRNHPKNATTARAISKPLQ